MPGVHHVHEVLQVKTVGNQLAQGAAIAILHPAVRTDEADHAVLLKQVQANVL